MSKARSDTVPRGGGGACGLRCVVCESAERVQLDGSDFKVRSQTYLKKKIKEDSCASMCRVCFICERFK